MAISPTAAIGERRAKFEKLEADLDTTLAKHHAGGTLTIYIETEYDEETVQQVLRKFRQAGWNVRWENWRHQREAKFTPRPPRPARR